MSDPLTRTELKKRLKNHSKYDKCPNCRKQRLVERYTATTKVHECVSCGYLQHWRREE